jgi:hypothetical protein
MTAAIPSPGRATSRLLSDECRRAVADLRKRCPGAFAAEPLPPGELAPEVTVETERAAKLFPLVFTELAGDGSEDGRVVWVRGDDALLVRVGDVRLLTRDGFVLVQIPVYTDQTRDAEVVVSFAVGSPDAPLGLIIGTEPVPRGPAIVTETWGDELTAAAFEALIAFAAAVAGASGVDDGHQPLLLAGIVASREALAITPQARHAVDRPTSPLGS